MTNFINHAVEFVLQILVIAGMIYVVYRMFKPKRRSTPVGVKHIAQMAKERGNEEEYAEENTAEKTDPYDEYPLPEYSKSIWYAIYKLSGRDFGKHLRTGKFLIGRTMDETETVKGIRWEARNAHFYVIGGTRTGKSRFLETLIGQDIFSRGAFGVIDPHGDLIEHMKIAYIGSQSGLDNKLEDQIVLIDPTDKDNSVCLNPLEPLAGVDSAVIAAEMVDAFAKIWGNSWGARMQEIFRNTLIALIENNLTLREVPLVFNDLALRKKLLANVKDELCIEFFEKYERWSERDHTEYTESTLNKLDDFLANRNVRDIFISPKSTFNIREIMDTGKTLLVNLDEGQLKGASDLLGSLIVSKIKMAAFSRSDLPDEKRTPYHLYIDEFQNFANENFVKVLSQSGKYGLFFTLANQNLTQLQSDLRASILSNCNLMACFRVSREDAEVMAKNLYGGVYDEPKDWETRIQTLQKFKEREFIFKNRTQGGISILKAFDAPLAWKPFRTEKDWKESGEERALLEIGRSYLRKREDIRAEYLKRREALGASDDINIKEKDMSYEEMIQNGENNEVEFKVSIRYGYNNGGKQVPIEHIIAKTISSFMNSEGGTLFIGVDNKGEIAGIENDYAAFRQKNKDGFLLKLDQIISQYVGREFHQYTSVKIVPIKGKDVCVVDVSKSKIAVFLKNDGKEEFYIRASASSQPMNPSEINGYINTHFPKMQNLTY